MALEMRPGLERRLKAEISQGEVLFASGDGVALAGGVLRLGPHAGTLLGPVDGR